MKFEFNLRVRGRRCFRSVILSIVCNDDWWIFRRWPLRRSRVTELLSDVGLINELGIRKRCLRICRFSCWTDGNWWLDDTVFIKGFEEEKWDEFFLFDCCCISEIRSTLPAIVFWWPFRNDEEISLKPTNVSNGISKHVRECVFNLIFNFDGDSWELNSNVWLFGKRFVERASS